MPLVHRLAAGLLLAAPAAAQAPDLEALFAPPQDHEIGLVRDDWAGRRVEPKGWRVEAAGMVSGHATRVLSHVVDGHRHYGLVRLPRNFAQGGTFPVLLFLHGGATGVGVTTLDSFDAILASTELPDEFVYVAPSFRSELLNAGPLGTFSSQGIPSRLDRDVDDAIALLSVALRAIPEADRLRVAAFGTSRGGGVALLLGARDERVRLLASSAGIADLMMRAVRDQAALLLASRSTAEDPVMRFVMKTAIEPYVSGHLSLSEARLALLRSSPARFAAQLPELQVHHGELDAVVSIAHSDQLASSMAAGRSHAPLEYWRYAEGQHTLDTMPGSGRRLGSYLSRLLSAPASYCGDAARDGARIGYTGEPSLAGNDWQLSVAGAPPGTPGLFLASPGSVRTPLLGGMLCVAPPFRRVAPARTGPDGSATVGIALGDFAPGSTWHFQFTWGDRQQQRFSDALRVTFLP
jgi:acetyl esterase/lipase